MMQWTLFLPALFASSLALKVGIVRGPGDEDFGELWRSLNLEPVSHRVAWWNARDVAVAVCSLAQQGVQALVMVGPPRLSPLVASYAAHMQLPLVSTGRASTNIVPDTSRAAASLIQEMKWNSFVFVYQTDIGTDKLQNILRHLEDTPHVEAFLRTNGAAETLEFVRNLSLTRLLLSTSELLADELVSKLATLRRSYEIVLLTPVATVQKTANPGSYRLMKFSILDEDSITLFKKNWKASKRYPVQKEFSDSLILSHDAGKLLQNLLAETAAIHPRENNFSCFNYSTNFPRNILNQATVKEALTGEISFSAKGKRSGYKLTIYEERPFQIKKIGYWDDESGLHLSPSDYQKPPVFAAFQDKSPVRVTSVLVKPFLFMNAAGTLEGYVVDFLEELKTVIQLPYRIQLAKDGGYGRVVQGFWNGMIGELVRKEADLAVAPLTKTRERAKVVDFSKNFMNFGLNILLKKPNFTEPDGASGPFMFLTVWSAELWLCILLSALVYGALCFLISRLVGAPDRVRAIESKGTDNLSPCGSTWFTLASLLQRDTGIYPRTFTNRMWAVVWWTFCFLLVAGYISSLSASLIKTRKSVTTVYSRKTSQEVIQDVLENGLPNIGVVKSGSTTQFFLNSDVGAYHELGRYLEKYPDNSMNSYDDGVQRVRDSGGSYAFIMESAGSQFHANLPPCDVVVSSGFLTTKSHAVAMQKNSPYKEMIDHGVLVLMENGVLRDLYEKWWHNYSSFCEDPSMNLLSKVYNKSLTLTEMSGVFYIFILFAVVSVASAFVQNYVSAKQISLD